MLLIIKACDFCLIVILGPLKLLFITHISRISTANIRCPKIPKRTIFIWKCTVFVRNRPFSCQSASREFFTSDVLVKIAGHETLVLFPRNQTVPRSTHAWDSDYFGRDRELKRTPEHGLDDLDLRLDIGLMTVNIFCRKCARSSFNRLV